MSANTGAWAGLPGGSAVGLAREVLGLIVGVVLDAILVVLDVVHVVLDEVPQYWKWYDTSVLRLLLWRLPGRKGTCALGWLRGRAPTRRLLGTGAGPGMGREVRPLKLLAGDMFAGCDGSQDDAKVAQRAAVGEKLAERRATAHSMQALVPGLGWPARCSARSSECAWYLTQYSPCLLWYLQYFMKHLLPRLPYLK